MAEERTFKERLLDVQAKLKAPKGQENKFGGYKYRSCEDILEAVKPLLAENGLLLTLTDMVVGQEDRVYVIATATLRDALSDERIEVKAYAREAEEKKGMDVAQVTGSASSYARKYALNGLFLIDDTRDDDAREPTDTAKCPAKQGKAPQNGSKAPQKPKGQTPEQAAKARLWSAMKAYCERQGQSQDAELELLGGKDFIGKQDAAWLNARAEYYEAN